MTSGSKVRPAASASHRIAEIHTAGQRQCKTSAGHCCSRHYRRCQQMGCLTTP